MQFEVEVCSRCGLAHIRLTGVVTGMGLRRVLCAFTEAGTWNLAQHDVWDLRGVQDLFIRPDEASMLAARTLPVADEAAAPEEASTSGLTAFVTRTISQKAYGIVLFQSIHPVSRLRRSFHSERPAVRWLADRSHYVSSTGGEESGACDAGCLLADERGAPSIEAMRA